MNNTKFYNNLDSKLPKVQEQFKLLNYGGCGRFANYVAKQLLNMGKQPRIAVVMSKKYYGLEECQEARKRFDGTALTFYPLSVLNNQYNIYASHIYVKVDDLYIDSSGVHTELPDNWLEIGTITAHTLKGWIKEENVWNVDFMHAHGGELRKISGRVRKFFKESLVD